MQGINLEQVLFDSLTEAVRLTLPEPFQEGDPLSTINPDTFSVFYGEFQKQVHNRLQQSILAIQEQIRNQSLILPDPEIIH